VTGRAPEVPRLVEGLFRRSAGEITAVLARRAGGAGVEGAEEAVQEAFVRALRSWPFQGVPRNPRGWLYRVAARWLADEGEKGRRRRTLLARARGEGGGWPGAGEEAPGESAGRSGELPWREGLPDPDRIADDELALLLLCCDPALPRVSQVMLTLKVGCGFGVREIAAAFLQRPATVAQRLVRAKGLLRRRGARPPEPTTAVLVARAGALREALYLLFTGGHAAAEGERAIRGELCGEALRLARLLLRHPGGDTPATRALAALFCLHGARLPARLDPEGTPLPLDRQDRSLWDRALLAEGLHHLEQSAGGDTLTRYHLEAAIAAVHAAAPSADETDWEEIVALYDALLDRWPLPVVALNRAVAVGRARGPGAGLAAVAAVAEEPSLAAYHLLPATLGALHAEAGRPEEAAAFFRAALGQAPSEADGRYLRQRLAELAG
jgi:RNA polymerase sigma-70 factor (ECF subfamily)